MNAMDVPIKPYTIKGLNESMALLSPLKHAAPLVCIIGEVRGVTRTDSHDLIEVCFHSLHSLMCSWRTRATGSSSSQRNRWPWSPSTSEPTRSLLHRSAPPPSRRDRCHLTSIQEPRSDLVSLRPVRGLRQPRASSSSSSNAPNCAARPLRKTAR